MTTPNISYLSRTAVTYDIYDNTLMHIAEEAGAAALSCGVCSDRMLIFNSWLSSVSSPPSNVGDTLTRKYIDTKHTYGWFQSTVSGTTSKLLGPYHHSIVTVCCSPPMKPPALYCVLHCSRMQPSGSRRNGAERRLHVRPGWVGH